MMPASRPATVPQISPAMLQASNDFLNPRRVSQQPGVAARGGAIQPPQGQLRPGAGSMMPALQAQPQNRGMMSMASRPVTGPVTGGMNAAGQYTPINMQAVTNSLRAGRR